MATTGGNLLQRTRCSTSATPRCRATSASRARAARRSTAQSHARGARHERALHRDASVGHGGRARRRSTRRCASAGPRGERTIPFADSTCLPGDIPRRETTLGAGRADHRGRRCRALPCATRSLYLKVRDRASYAFALASAAVALDLDDGTIRDARVALGGVAHQAVAVARSGAGAPRSSRW